MGAGKHTECAHAPTRSNPGILPPFDSAAAAALPAAGADHFAVTVFGCVKNWTPALPYMCKSPTKLPRQPVKLNMGRGTGIGTLIPTMPTCEADITARHSTVSSRALVPDGAHRQLVSRVFHSDTNSCSGYAQRVTAEPFTGCSNEVCCTLHPS